MKYASLAALFLCSLAPGIAEEALPPAEIETVAEGEVRPSFQFAEGATLCTMYGYQVKLTAQQRRKDKLVQVIAYPQEEGIHFRIQHVQFGKAAPSMGFSGRVAEVHGHFIARINIQAPVRVPLVIPVRVLPVEEFTVSSDDARMQGNPCVEKQLEKMVSEE